MSKRPANTNSTGNSDLDDVVAALAQFGMTAITLAELERLRTPPGSVITRENLHDAIREILLEMLPHRESEHTEHAAQSFAARFNDAPIDAVTRQRARAMARKIAERKGRSR